MMNEKPSFAPLWTIAVTVLLAAVVMSVLPEEQGPALVRENGPVESLTVWLYLAACAWLLVRCSRTQRVWNFSASILVLLLALRELDFHARFTTMGILKSRYYLSPEVPGGEKVTVILIILCIIGLAAAFLWHSWPAFLGALYRRERSAVAVALAFGFAVVSKIMDGFSSEIRALLKPFYGDSKTYLRVYEESLELGIPLFILAALWFSRHFIQARGRLPDPD